MISRQKLLDAAARVYGQYGFRGATTRLIAEAIRSHAPEAVHGVGLPEQPVDPEHELAEWCQAQLDHLRGMRSLIRKAMGELEEHPEMAPCMSRMPSSSARQLRSYAGKLTGGSRSLRPRELSAATAMLMGALFGDAMWRELMPELH